MSASPPPEWHLTETYKGLITLSVEALKLLALANGGAAVALLTYLGNLPARLSTAAHPPNVKAALLWYCGGLLATTLAFIDAYVTQLVLYNEERRRRVKPVPQFHAIGIWIGVALALTAAISFGMGCRGAARAIGAWGSQYLALSIFNRLNTHCACSQGGRALGAERPEPQSLSAIR